MVSKITAKNFDEVVLNASMPVVVDFYADWCGPCKMVGPVLEALADELESNVRFCKVNVDDSPDVAGNYSVMSIPTIIVFKDGKIFDKKVGFDSKEALAEMITKAI